MKKQNPIDEIFMDDLYHYEEDVPVRVWEGINGKLNHNKRVHLRYVYFSIAASVALFISFMSGIYIANQSKSESSPKIVYKYLPSPAIKNTSISGNIANQKNISLSQPGNNDQSENLNIANLKSKDENSEYTANLPLAFEPLIQSEPLNSEKQDTVIQPLYSEKRLSLKLPVFNTISSGICYSEQIVLPPLDPIEGSIERKKEWTLSGDLSPLGIYNSNSQSNYSGQFKSKEKNIADLSYSGGLKIKYLLTPRLHIQSGVTYAALVHRSELEVKSTTYNFSQSTPLGRVETTLSQPLVVLNDRPGQSGSPDQVTGQLNQSVDYIEVPLIFRYKVIDQKIDWVISIGVGTGYLVKNSAVFIDGDKKTILGKTQGVDDFNYSSMFSITAEYPISKKIFFSVEPTFKYYFRNFGGSGYYKPFTFGVSSGFSYSF